MKNLVAILISSIAIAGCTKPEPSNTATTTATSANQSKSNVPSKPIAQIAIRKYDGPFGLAMGIPQAELLRMGFKETSEHSSIFAGEPPRPMESVSSYIVVAAPNTGACKIRASVNVPVVNGSGDQLKSAVDRLAEAMQVKYGKHSAKYEVAQETYRRNPQFWMMGLKESSVVYAYAWMAGKTEQPLPEDISAIEIGADATSMSEGTANMVYSFKNFDACAKEFKAMRAANL